MTQEKFLENAELNISTFLKRKKINEKLKM